MYTVEEVGKNVEASSDRIAHKVLPSFGSHDSGDCACIASYNETVLRSPKAPRRPAYKGVMPSPTRKTLTELDHES